jgi:hypothetical protein
MNRLVALVVLAFASFPIIFELRAQGADGRYFSDFHWRLVGPHRAGRLWALGRRGRRGGSDDVLCRLTAEHLDHARGSQVADDLLQRHLFPRAASACSGSCSSEAFWVASRPCAAGGGVASRHGVTRPLELADAQFASARENGFDSWRHSSTPCSSARSADSAPAVCREGRPGSRRHKYGITVSCARQLIFLMESTVN